MYAFLIDVHMSLSTVPLLVGGVHPKSPQAHSEKSSWKWKKLLASTYKGDSFFY
jgi:hypothetical protein